MSRAPTKDTPAALEITADDVEVQCDYIGGGFGSKFAVDYWGIAAAKISKETGRPVKFMLDRDQELKIAGNRPSGFIKVQLGADEDGVVQVWDSEHWGTAGFTGSGVSHNVVPYVYMPPNYRRNAIDIKTNTDQSRAWRAPNHPQACAMSQTAYDDLAREMKADSLEIFKKNLKHIESRQKAEVYAAEMEIAAKLMDWKAKWHPHGQGAEEGLDRRRPRHGDSHLGWRCEQQQLHAKALSRRQRRNILRHARPRHRHAHCVRDSRRRNIWPQAESNQGQHRQFEVSRAAALRAAAPRSAPFPNRIAAPHRMR